MYKQIFQTQNGLVTIVKKLTENFLRTDLHLVHLVALIGRRQSRGMRVTWAERKWRVAANDSWLAGGGTRRRQWEYDRERSQVKFDFLHTSSAQLELVYLLQAWFESANSLDIIRTELYF